MSEGTKSIRREAIAQGEDSIDVSDVPELGAEFFKNAKLRGPMVQMHTALVDRDVYEWFQSQGPDYLQRMNQLLREYMLSSLERSKP
jgi:uncharacterized protein (DUF4415 family)